MSVDFIRRIGAAFRTLFSWHLARRCGGTAVRLLVVFAVVHTFQWYLERRPIGRFWTNFEYAVLQNTLRTFTTRPVTDADRARLPLVIDISSSRPTGSAISSRAQLRTLVDSLRCMGASAIGIDIDFSPAASGEMVGGADDKQLLQHWADGDYECENGRGPAGRVRVGVFRHQGEGRSDWLGHPAYAPLAAGILIPEGAPGYAYLYTSRVVDEPSPAGEKRRSDDPDQLLQMPAALYADSHRPQDFAAAANRARETSDSGGRMAVSVFPIDFSSLSVIDVVPYRRPDDLEHWKAKIENHVVLIGDVEDASDARAIPISDRPVPGVMIHAAAFATLNLGRLRYVDDEDTKVIALLLFVLVAVVVNVAVETVKEWQRRRGSKRVVSDRFLEIVVALALSAFVFLVGVWLIDLGDLFWPGSIALSIVLFIDPYLAHLLSVLWRAVRAGLREVGTKEALS